MSSHESSSDPKPAKDADPLSPVPCFTRVIATLLLKIRDTAFRPDGTIKRRLITIIDFKTSAARKPVKGVRSFDITVDPSRKLWFRLFVPDVSSTGALPLIVYFHGGGFASMSASSWPYDALCRRIASELHVLVASIEYRLSPEYRFPCQYEDGFDALSYIVENSGTLPGNADLSRCFLAGDSAGGNLAHHVAVRVAQSNLKTLKIKGLIAIQPFFGGEERTESEIRYKNTPPLLSVALTDWFWRAFLPEGADKNHGAANVMGPNGVDISTLAEFPQAIVITGEKDPLHDWQVRYCEWLRQSGKEAERVYYPNTIHGFYGFPELLDATQLLQKIKEFVDRMCGV